MNTQAADQTLFDFHHTESSDAWQIVNDDVMGGISRSRFYVTNSLAVFRGEVSLENNGGFASVRSRPLKTPLAEADAFVIRVRGDGRQYKFTARMDNAFDGPVYQAVFRTRQGEWEEHTLPLRQFVPSYRGRQLPGEPPLQAPKVSSVGFLISDKQEGPFQLTVAWIKAIKTPPVEAPKP